MKNPSRADAPEGFADLSIFFPASILRAEHLHAYADRADWRCAHTSARRTTAVGGVRADMSLSTCGVTISCGIHNISPREYQLARVCSGIAGLADCLCRFRSSHFPCERLPEFVNAPCCLPVSERTRGHWLIIPGLTDEETAGLLRELVDIIDGDRFPLSPRILTLKAIRAKIRPEPVREPLPPAKRYEPLRATAARRRHSGR